MQRSDSRLARVCAQAVLISLLGGAVLFDGGPLRLRLVPAVEANSTYHLLSGGNLMQDWSNTGLITAGDDWSGVPSIVGFRGDALTGGTGTDPQTLLADDSPGVVDVNQGQTNPDTNTAGGVTEFEITNPVVALQGSSTADAPYLLLHVNTTGVATVNISYNVRDIDGSADNAAQQVALQYRTGGTGGYTNVPAGYVADATTAGTATQVTPVSVTLPGAAGNQSQLQIRIMTTNAAGNDEWVGIDDIVVSAGGPPAPALSLMISPSTFSEAAGTNVATGTVTRNNDPAMNANMLMVTLSNPDTSEVTVPASVVIPAMAASTTFQVDAVDDMTADGTQNVTITAAAGGFTNGTAGVLVTDNDVVLTLISAVQGDVTALASPANASPLAGSSVTIQGVVTNVVSNGFYLQEEVADDDGNINTSDAVFVFTSSAPAVALGNIARVSGNVVEFQPGGPSGNNLTITEITGPMVTVLGTIADGGAPGIDITDLRNAVNIRTLTNIPNSVIYSTMNPNDPNTGIEFWESVEGAIVEITSGAVVGQTNTFGEFAVVAPGNQGAGSGYFSTTGNIIIQPSDPLYTDVSNPPTIGGGDFNPERIFIDDKNGAVTSPLVEPDGDVVNNIVGTVDYSFGLYKIQPVFTLTDVVQNSATDSFTPQGSQLRVVTFNFENLFDTINEAGRADSPILTVPEFNTKVEKIRRCITGPLALPDIIVCPEVENPAVVQAVADAVNTFTGTTNYVARSLDAADDRSIEVGFLYNANRVSLQSPFTPASLLTPPGNPGSGTTVGDDNHVRSASAGPFADLNLGTSFIADTAEVFEGGTGAPFSDSREPLVGVFRFNGQDIVVIGVHLASKGGDEALFGLNQPPVRGTEAQRKLQGQYVRQLVDLFFTGDAGRNIPAFDKILVTGDFNDFHFPEAGETGMDAVTTIQGLGVPANRFLQNLINYVTPEERYTYVFDANAQALDHMLVSPALFATLTAQDVAHINADYRVAFEADNTTFIRSSDHDPLGGTFNLSAPNVTPMANAGTNQTLNSCTIVNLNGTGSTDPDSGPSPLTYSWTQTAGPPVVITNPASATASFEAPNVSVSAVLTFQLTVSDGLAMNSDSVDVTVNQVAGVHVDTVGLHTSSAFYFLRNCNGAGPADVTFNFGGANWIPLRGDWDNDGDETAGAFDPVNAVFYLKNSNSSGSADGGTIFFGAPGDMPVVGDWDGNGTVTIGVYRPSTSQFFLKQTNTGGAPDVTVNYGVSGANFLPIVGDWDGNGTWTVGLFQTTSAGWFLRNSNTDGDADMTVVYGPPAGSDWVPVVGDWDGVGGHTPGLYQRSTSFFWLKNSVSGGAADVFFQFGLPGTFTPMAGNWDGF